MLVHWPAPSLNLQSEKGLSVLLKFGNTKLLQKKVLRGKYLGQG